MKKTDDGSSVKFVNTLDFRVAGVTYEIAKEGHALFLVKVLGPYDASFTFKDRYSSLSDFQEKIKKQLEIPKDKLPAFPAKKYFGATDPEFLKTRC